VPAPAVLCTPRLVLRPWRDSDLDPFAELNADPVTMEFFPETLGRAESDALAGRLRRGIDEQGFGLWATEVIGGADFIGFIGLSVTPYETPFTPCVEIGWRLHRAHWGRGFATEGARAAIRDGFDRLGLASIVSFTAVLNTRSRRVMEKLGMRRRVEEDFDHPRLPEGHPLRRHVLYRLASGDFDAQRGGEAGASVSAGDVRAGRSPGSTGA
jgi:RimJ/RimL family protein N-acetyltransferase